MNHFKISLEQCPKTDSKIKVMYKIPYASAVGYLMYVLVCTRPNLEQAISKICKFMSRPGKHRWGAVKGIPKYSKGITDHGIMFIMEQDVPSVV